MLTIEGLHQGIQRPLAFVAQRRPICPRGTRDADRLTHDLRPSREVCGGERHRCREQDVRCGPARPGEGAPLVGDGFGEILGEILEKTESHGDAALEGELFEHAHAEAVDGRHGQAVEREQQRGEPLLHRDATGREHGRDPRLVSERGFAFTHMLHAMQLLAEALLQLGRRGARERDGQ